VQIDSSDSNSDDDGRKTKAVPSMKKKKAEKVTVQGKKRKKEVGFEVCSTFGR
jgi:hypothetical protein